MENKLIKRVMSLVLVVVMAVSTMAVSAFSVSAASTKTYTYRLTIKTGAKSGAGTDADVYLHLYNSDGTRFSRQAIDPKGDSFEKGKTDYATITTSKPIMNLKLSAMGDLFNEIGGDWYPEYVLVEEMDGDKVVHSTKYIFKTWVECGHYDTTIPNPGGQGTFSPAVEYITNPTSVENIL